MDTKKKLEVISSLIDRKLQELEIEIETLKESIYDDSDIYNITLLGNLYEEKKEFEYYSKILKNYHKIFNKNEIEYAEKHLYLDLITNVRIVEVINKRRFEMDSQRFSQGKVINSNVDEDYMTHTQISFDIHKGKVK